MKKFIILMIAVLGMAFTTESVKEAPSKAQVAYFNSKYGVLKDFKIHKKVMYPMCDDDIWNGPIPCTQCEDTELNRECEASEHTESGYSWRVYMKTECWDYVWGWGTPIAAENFRDWEWDYDSQTECN